MTDPSKPFSASRRSLLAYRFDFHDRSIAFSGDTMPSDTVVRLAKGADILERPKLWR